MVSREAGKRPRRTLGLLAQAATMYDDFAPFSLIDAVAERHGLTREQAVELIRESAVPG